MVNEVAGFYNIEWPIFEYRSQLVYRQMRFEVNASRHASLYNHLHRVGITRASTVVLPRKLVERFGTREGLEALRLVCFHGLVARAIRPVPSAQVMRSRNIHPIVAEGL
jgi:hypothetical protein